MNEARSARYWNATADLYQQQTRISTADFHYGPLLPGDTELDLLPPDMKALRCLEVGCGAGQNSIYLAGRGGVCVGLDIAETQLAHGRRLAAEHGVQVDFRGCDMDALPLKDLGRFDLVHSTYGLPFSTDPGLVIRNCAEMLVPGGCLLLTTGHPVYAGEWVDAGNGEEGMLIHNYFDPPEDERVPETGHEGACARYYSMARLAEWMHDAGLMIDRLLEPRPLPIPVMSEEEIRARVPYESDDWRAMYEILAAIPIVAIFRCIKPSPNMPASPYGKLIEFGHAPAYDADR